jgi:hypothetical protein
MLIIKTIEFRKSCRTYGDKAIESEKLDELRQFLATNIKAPFGNRVRFDLIDLNEMDVADLNKLTTYGVIKGARQFIVGTTEKNPKAMEDYGYCMEKNILKATSMSLGTCWLGGTFKRSGFAEKIGITESEVLPAISPVGYAGDKKTVVDRLFRFVAASDKRKPWNELFFLQDTNHILDDQNSGKFKAPLQCLQMAPSASNKQPWRIIKDKGQDAFHFYLRRTPGYGNIAPDIQLQNVDMGIAMCHFELSARELGLAGEWCAKDPQSKKGDWEYIVSWL